MTKVAIIGAGSGFGGRLSVDTLARKPLQDATIALCDLHPERLAGVRGYVERTIEAHKLPARVEAVIEERLGRLDAQQLAAGCEGIQRFLKLTDIIPGLVDGDELCGAVPVFPIVTSGEMPVGGLVTV